VHATAHDYNLTDASGQSDNTSRKVLASSLAHLAVILTWISGMLFHGSYFSNYVEWLVDPTHVKPSSHFVWSVVGQDILNSDLGGYFQGIYISSGLFHLWRSQGFLSYTNLKCASCVAILAALMFIGLSFYVMHLWPIKHTTNLLSYRTLVLILGLASISWSAHIIHISSPIASLLESGVEPSFIVAPQELLSRDVMRSIYPGFGSSSLLSFSAFDTGYSSMANVVINGYTDATGSIPLYAVAAHHLYLGLALIFSVLLLKPQSSSVSDITDTGSTLNFTWHGQLSIALLITATFSFIHAHNIYSAAVYPYLACDYASQVSLYTHHMWIGGFLMIGHGAHASIFMVQDLTSRQTTALITKIISHRDIILGHLIWVVIFLGFHAFGLYIHNDTLQALGRPEDTFSDSAIQLKPLLATLAGFSVSASATDELHIHVLGSKLYNAQQFLGTADFMIHHIHAFTIHTTALLILKGVLYSRSSRLVSDKKTLGFRYPCDGPGRGGTCQISPWDHIFLGLFWMYNSISILIFHFFWKMQSDVWGSFSTKGHQLTISHLTSGDFSSNSTSINGWLRTFLWSQSAQVIQSYSTSSSAYGLVFLGSHLIWAFSLMFLYSGRGYWQELIESILWAHYKLRVIPQIQPRALSISQGRAVGVAHYILGGIGCTWSFFISRMVALSY